ncbi:MAG: hypothetical protein HKN19_04725 [Halioglobus sp.]|nr:hypothetical protein [Halioglobus sp.]
MLFAGTCQHAAAHSLSPSLVELVEVDGAEYAMRIKQPLKRAQVEAVDALFPAECATVGEWDERRTLDSRILEGRVTCGGTSLAGNLLSFPRLAQSAASLVLKVRWQSGASFTAVVRASDPTVVVPAGSSLARVFRDYFVFGMGHLVTGLDHLAFLAALVLLVQRLRPLIAVVTAFTLGHALSVVLVTLGVVSVSSHWVEIFIALSIVVLALDVYFREREQRGVLRTVLLCVAFGVLHGMGFASALDIADLARLDKAVALLAFNLGIELVQVFIVSGIAALLWLLFTRARVPQGALLKTSACLIGVLGALWFWERLLGFMLQARLL